MEEAQLQDRVAASVVFQRGEEQVGAELQVPGFGARAGAPALLPELLKQADPGVCGGGGEGERGRQQREFGDGNGNGNGGSP